MKKEFYIGRAKELGKVSVRIELKNKEFHESICPKCKGTSEVITDQGVMVKCTDCTNGKVYERYTTELKPFVGRFWEVSICGSARGRGGQMQDSIREAEWYERYIPEDKLNRLLDIWDRWHLNDMNGGSDLQQQIIKWFYDEKAIKNMVLNRMKNELTVSRELADQFCDVFFAEKDDDRSRALAQLVAKFDKNSVRIATKMKEYQLAHQSHYELASELLKHHCLYNDCGYRYGSKWLIEPVPEDVIQFLESLPAYVDTTGTNQLDPRWEWMVEHKIKCLSVKPTDYNPNFKSDREMDHWIAVFENEMGEQFKAHYSTGIGHRIGEGEYATHFRKKNKLTFYLKWFKDNNITTGFTSGYAIGMGEERRGIPKPPYPYEILGALIDDCASINCYRDWMDWANELGYDINDKKQRREAKKTYITIEEISDELSSFLGRSDFIDLYNDVFMD